MQVSIILPCLNEERTLKICIDNIKKFMPENVEYEILVVDNGSTDRSVLIAEWLGVRVVIETKRGYGYAIQRGIKEAKYENVVMLDADCSYSLENVMDFLAMLNKYDFVCGNRFAGGIEHGAMPLSHKIGAPVLSFIGKIKFHSCINDFHCGLRAFKKSIYDGIEFRTSGMDFATEMIAIAESVTNHNTTEIPVRLYKDKRKTKSHLNTVRDGLKHLVFILGTEGSFYVQ